ncbi:hypothetical protein ADH76_21100 [Enterocloster clostridioformis]|nr:hypothetical protein A4V08_17035 [Lachnoclostridium sp. YL32]OXE66454.1 hypothetical protein ADH76_21100 [Enterocloster clostridioformis]
MRKAIEKSRRFLTVIEETILHSGKGNVPKAIPYPPAQEPRPNLETVSQKQAATIPQNGQRRACTWDKIRKAGKLLRRFGSDVYFCANFEYNISTKGMIP